MNQARRRRRGGAEAQAAGTMRALLKAEAARHEPDRERILAAVERGTRSPAAVPGRSSSGRRPATARRPTFAGRPGVGRWRPPVLAAAAATSAVLLGGAWTGWTALIDAGSSEVTVVGSPAAGGAPGRGDSIAPVTPPSGSSPVASGSGPVSPSAATTGPARPAGSEPGSGPGSGATPQSAPAGAGEGRPVPAGQAGRAGPAPGGSGVGAPAPATPGVAVPPGAGGAPATTRTPDPAPATPPPPAATGTSTAAPGPAAVPAPALSATSVGAGSAVTLPGPGDLDWLIVGARRDGRVIRAKRSTGAIAVPVGVGAAPTVEPGPYTVSWSSGAPEQDHQGATTWWTVPAGALLRVEVVPAGAREVRLNLGTVGARGTVSARLTDGAAATLGLPSGAAVVIVRVPATSGTQRLVIELSGVPTGPDARLGLSAVAVR